MANEAAEGPYYTIKKGGKFTRAGWSPLEAGDDETVVRYDSQHQPAIDEIRSGRASVKAAKDAEIKTLKDKPGKSVEERLSLIEQVLGIE